MQSDWMESELINIRSDPVKLFTAVWVLFNASQYRRVCLLYSKLFPPALAFASFFLRLLLIGPSFSSCTSTLAGHFS